VSTTVSLNGSNHSIPAVGERNWGSNVTNYLIAIASGVLQRSGGSQPLTADLNLGTSYGLVAKYLKSTGSNIATAGVLMLANSESIGWRNNANSADKLLKVNTSDRLEYDGYNLVTINSTDTLTNKTLTAPVIASIVNTGTLTLPSSTDTLVGRATTDTLTNKTLTAPIISTISNTGTLTLPTSTDTLVGRATTDTLTNKTLDAPVVDNGLTMNHESTPATPSASTVKVYPKSDNSLYVLDSNGVETQVGSGTGQGEKNYITNPSAKSALNGWAISGAGTLARTTTAANLPREFTTGTALSFTSSTNGEYVRFRFSLDDVDLAKKLKWVLDYISSTANFRLEMWKNSASNYGGSYTEIALENDVSGDSYLVAAAASANYRTTFDTDTTPYLELRIVHNGTGTDTIYFSDVLVGPGTTGTVPADSYLGRYNTITTQGFGTPTSIYIDYWRTGNRLRAKGTFITGTVTADEARITIPFSLTSNLPQAASTDTVVGTWNRQTASGSAFKTGTLIGKTGETVLAFSQNNFSTAGTGPGNRQAGSAISGSSENIYFEFEIGISAWEGSVQTGPGIAEEFAFNTGTTATANSNNSVATSAIGAGGTAILSFNSTTANATTDFVVRFQYPFQNDETYVIEINNGFGWMDAQYIFPFIVLNTSYYGIVGGAPSGTDVTISFGNQGARPIGAATYAASGQAWSTFAAYKWRVRKTKKAALPFANASSTTTGLVAPRKGQYSLTVTSSLGSWSTARAIGLYYQDQDGNHRMKFNISGTCTAGTVNELTLSGVTFKSGYQQACSVIAIGTAPYYGSAQAVGGTGRVDCFGTSSGTWSVSGDVELNSKPTWA
jgi:hypothetical protein